MEMYFKCQPQHNTANPLTADNAGAEKALISEYDRYRQTLVDMDDDEGWASELRRYLKDRPADVLKETDIVKWWQVCSYLLSSICFM
jgi:SNF2 family DNA or RNA helicase